MSGGVIGGGGGGGGGTPGGSAGQFQFNSAGAFAGATGLTYSSGTGRVSLPGMTANRMLSLNTFSTLTEVLISGNVFAKGNAGGTLSDGLLSDDGTDLRYTGLGNFRLGASGDVGFFRAAAGRVQVSDGTTAAGGQIAANYYGDPAFTSYMVPGGGVIDFYANNGARMRLGTIASFTVGLGFGTVIGTNDVGLLRSSAGAIKVTDASTSGDGTLSVINVVSGAADNTGLTILPGANASAGFYLFRRGAGCELSVGALTVGTPTIFFNSSNRTGLFFYNASFGIDGGFAYQPEQTPDALMLLPGSLSNSIVFAEYADRTFDFAHAQATDPSLFIHSHNQSTTEWIGFSHNGTDAAIAAGTGALLLTGVTGGVKFDRTITATSATGAVTINKLSGTLNSSAGTTTVIVTNSLVGLNSIIYATVRTADATAAVKNIVAASSGAFTITLTAPTGQVSIGFLVTN